MEKLTKISNIKHTAGIALGILAALVILVSQSFYFDYVAKSECKVKTEKSDQEQTILKIGQEAVAQAANVTLHNVLHFISEIFLDDSSEVHIDIKLQPEFNSLFNTLFRLIISPNAP
jgi:hypothetical protein